MLYRKCPVFLLLFIHLFFCTVLLGNEKFQEHNSKETALVPLKKTTLCTAALAASSQFHTRSKDTAEMTASAHNILRMFRWHELNEKEVYKGSLKEVQTDSRSARKWKRHKIAQRIFTAERHFFEPEKYKTYDASSEGKVIGTVIRGKEDILSYLGSLLRIHVKYHFLQKIDPTAEARLFGDKCLFVADLSLVFMFGSQIVDFWSSAQCDAVDVLFQFIFVWLFLRSGKDILNYLDNFESGFYDEANKLQLELDKPTEGFWWYQARSVQIHQDALRSAGTGIFNPRPDDLALSAINHSPYKLTRLDTTEPAFLNFYVDTLFHYDSKTKEPELLILLRTFKQKPPLPVHKRQSIFQTVGSVVPASVRGI